jgi:alcohol dehydrogenase
MKAAVLLGHGDLDRIVYQDFPDPVIAPDEVLLTVGATSVNFHDLFTRRGMPGISISFPLITGSDVAGEIREVGESVEGWKRGDRVLVDPVRWDASKPGMIGETSHGGRAELLSVHASQLIRMPDNVSFEAAASLPLAYGTAYRMMVTRGRVAAGEKVLILGASGGVGTACVLLAKLVGAEVLACASSDSKLERLRNLGADHLINYREEQFREAVRRVCGKPRVLGGGGVDVVVNFTGGDTWVDSLKCLAKGGRLLTCGATAGFDPKTDIRYIWTFEQNIMGSDGWQREDLEELLRLESDKSLSPVIDKVMPLSQAREAEAMVEEREVFGKIVLVP